MKDWKDDPIPKDEPDEKEVLAWHIEPTDDGDSDYYLIRDYDHARDTAYRLLELAMDGVAEDDLSNETGTTVFRVSLERTTCRELRLIGSMPEIGETTP